MRRLKACVEAWPECYSGGYDPKCCRFPKSCSCDCYYEDYVKEEDLEECDQDGTNTFSGYVMKLQKGQTADEPNMVVLSPKTTELSPQDIMDHLPAADLALLVSALGDCYQMKSANPSRRMKTVSLSMQSKMLLLTLTAHLLEVPLSTSQGNNVICVENSHRPPELKELSGLMEKNDLTLAQWRKTLWDQSRTSFMKRCKERDNK